MFNNLLPKETKFFTIFNSASDNVLKAAEQLDVLFHEPAFDLNSPIIEEIRLLEHRGDEYTAELHSLLSVTFLTPFDDTEIRHLTDKLDNVVDGIKSVVDNIVLYRIQAPTLEMTMLSATLYDMAKIIQKSVYSIDDKSKYTNILKDVLFLHTKESMADGISRVATEKMVDALLNPTAVGLLVISGRVLVNVLGDEKIIKQLEKAIDACEDVGDVLGTIIQKNG